MLGFHHIPHLVSVVLPRSPYLPLCVPTCVLSPWSFLSEPCEDRRQQTPHGLWVWALEGPPL